MFSVKIKFENKLKRLLSVVLVLPVIACVFSVCAFAQSKNIFNLTERKDMLVSVSYDKSAPSISFISPDGTEISEDKYTKTDSGSVLYFVIKDAAAGQWQIKYEKGNNTDLEVAWGPYTPAATISSFSYSKTSDNNLTANFNVKCDESLYYNYVIYVVTLENDEVSGTKQVCTGSAKTNENASANVSLSGLSTYDKYSLQLEVYYTYNNSEVFDSAVASDTFSYDNPNSGEAIQSFIVEVNASDNSIDVTWADAAVYCSNYIVSAYADDSAEPFYIKQLGSNIYGDAFLFDENYKKIEVRLNYVYNGVTSKAASKSFSTALLDCVKLDISEVTTAAQVSLSYDLSSLGSVAIAEVTVNENSERVRMSGSGSVSLNIGSFDNEISAVWYAENDESLRFRVDGETYSDRTAPSLSLYGIKGGSVKTQEKNYVLTGSTDAGCSVTVNGEAVETDKNGIFTATLSLNDGANQFTVVATGPSGTSSQATFTVEKSGATMEDLTGMSSGLISYIPLILSLVFSVLIVLSVVLVGKKYSKQSAENSKKKAIFNALRTAMILLAVVLMIACVTLAYFAFKAKSAINNKEFIDVVTKSVVTAYEMVERANSLMMWAIAAGCGALVCIILAVAITVLMNKNPSDKKTPGNKNKADTAVNAQSNASEPYHSTVNVASASPGLNPQAERLKRKYPPGRCMKCGRQAPSVYPAVINERGQTRQIMLCESCHRQFTGNFR